MPRLSDVLAGLGQGAYAELESQRKRKQEHQEKLSLLEAEARLKQQYDPEAIVKNRIINLAGVAAERARQRPQLTVAPSAPPDARLRLQGMLQRSQQEAGEEAELNVLRHILPRQPKSLEELVLESQARSTGRIQGELSAVGATPGTGGGNILNVSGQPMVKTVQRIGGSTYELPAEQAGERKAVVESINKDFQAASRLGSSLRQISTVTSQFMKALPSEDRSALEQRFSGFASTIGARTGIKPNPQLLSLLSNQRLQANELIRSFGEVGNLSQSDINAAIAAYNQSGLTDEERLAKLVQMAEWISAKMSPRARRFLIEEDPQTIEIFEGLGVNILDPPQVTSLDFLSPQPSLVSGGDKESVKARLRAKYGRR